MLSGCPERRRPEIADTQDTLQAERDDEAHDPNERKRTTQEVSFEIEVVYCPNVTGISALPLRVIVGYSLELIAEGADLDAELRWSGPGGTFSDPERSSTLFTCTEVGAHELTIMAAAPHCDDAVSHVTVYCEAEP